MDLGCSLIKCMGKHISSLESNCVKDIGDLAFCRVSITDIYIQFPMSLLTHQCDV